MAAPTQEYPPWLTPVVSIITDAAGVPVTTSTNVLFLPLTYYGPSIPLNSDWTYGGLTSPASTIAPTPTSQPVSITTPSVTPTNLTPLSSSASPTSSSTHSPVPTSISLSSSTTSSLSSSASPSSSVVSATGSTLTRGQLIGVIIASILGVIVLFVLAISIYLWCKGRRSRQRDPRFSIVTPIEQDYLVVGEDGRVPGEGSPRHSGEEADTFLRPPGRAGESTQQMQQLDPEMGGRSTAGPSRKVPRVPAPVADSTASSAGSSSNNSGYGSVIEPTIGKIPATLEVDRERRGRILTPEGLRQTTEESVLPTQGESTEDSPLMEPPRLLDPGAASGPKIERSPFKTEASSLPHGTTHPGVDEVPTSLPAHRVKIDDLASSPYPPQVTFPDVGPSNRNSGGILGSLGLGSLSHFGRMSWFKNTDAGSRRTSHTPSFIASRLSDQDIEAGRALLGNSQISESSSSRSLGVGLGPDGMRPVSNVSARSGKSGGTVYHDAYSSLPGTPSLMPPPRVLTPSAQTSLEGGWHPSTVGGDPPAYNVLDPSLPLPHGATSVNNTIPEGFDVLDLPAPPAISPFTSTSSLRETTTSSDGTRATPYPPGLDFGALSPPKAWTDASSSTTQPTLAVMSGADNTAGISIDVLEEEPPTAGEGWRSMAAVINSAYGDNRRTTFGMPRFVRSPDRTSEQGSLHSMRSHLSPSSSQSTGSAPASRRNMSGSLGSGSSKPSAARTHSSGGSLAHSGSISSNGGRRGLNQGPVSPALSAFGPNGPDQFLGPGSPPRAHFTPERVSPVRPATADSTVGETLQGVRSGPPSPTSPLIQFSNAPWAAGLDRHWTAT